MSAPVMQKRPNKPTKRKTYKISAKLKARCRYLKIDPIPISNAARKLAIKKVIGTLNWPEYLHGTEDKGAGYQKILTGLEGEYQSTFRASKQADAVAKRDLRAAKYKERVANAVIAADNKKARQKAMSEKAQEANRKSKIAKDLEKKLKEEAMALKKQDRIKRLQKKVDREKAKAA